ncbi:hypothetical protein INT47_000959, partial [Mucor saturninus]
YNEEKGHFIRFHNMMLNIELAFKVQDGLRKKSCHYRTADNTCRNESILRSNSATFLLDNKSLVYSISSCQCSDLDHSTINSFRINTRVSSIINISQLGIFSGIEFTSFL